MQPDWRNSEIETKIEVIAEGKYVRPDQGQREKCAIGYSPCTLPCFYAGFPFNAYHDDDKENGCKAKHDGKNKDASIAHGGKQTTNSRSQQEACIEKRAENAIGGSALLGRHSVRDQSASRGQGRCRCHALCEA